MDSLPAAAPLWEPSPERVRDAQITRFATWAGERHGLAFPAYEDLWRWSVDAPEDFWRAAWDWFDLRSATPVPRMLCDDRMPGARWCDGAQLNYVEQMLRHRDLPSPAILFDSEAAGEGSVSWGELERDVAAFARTLRALGVSRGDRVAAILPNIPQTVVAFMAVASIGAIWSICSPDMGPISISDRFRQIEPKVLIACDGYRFAGKPHDRRSTLHAVLDALPGVQSLVWVPHLDVHAAPDPAMRAVPVTSWRDATAWQPADAAFAPEALPFDHPLWIVYSSGTTGLPKPIVHGHGGVLLSGVVTMGLQTDVGAGHRFFWSVSTGWIVWNLQVMGLLTGATIVLYDGCVSGQGKAPDWSHLWQLVERLQVQTFGAGAAFFASCLKADVRPSQLANLSALTAIQSSGSPLSPECYRWIYDEVKPDLWLASISGGTDIAGGFVVGSPTLPVYEGELQCRNLGCAVHAFDEGGRPVIGEVGELVCTQPIPSMPLFFWNDADGQRMFDSYFGMFQGPDGRNVWRHGDWLKLVPHPQGTGGIIYGRSDATINRAGIRMGTAEFYRVVEAEPEVLDSLVVDLEFLGRPSWLGLFVVLRGGVGAAGASPESGAAAEQGVAAVPDDELLARLRAAIRSGLSARHVPDEILVVPAIPRTLTGKKLELPIKKLLLGQPVERVVNRDAIGDPAAVDWFVAFAARRLAASAGAGGGDAGSPAP